MLKVTLASLLLMNNKFLRIPKRRIWLKGNHLILVIHSRRWTLWQRGRPRADSIGSFQDSRHFLKKKVKVVRRITIYRRLLALRCKIVVVAVRRLFRTSWNQPRARKISNKLRYTWTLSLGEHFEPHYDKVDWELHNYKTDKTRESGRNTLLNTTKIYINNLGNSGRN